MKMEKIRKNLPAKFGVKFCWMVLGVTMMGLGLSVLMKLHLGTDPYSCFGIGLAAKFHLNYGTVQLIPPGNHVSCGFTVGQAADGDRDNSQYGLCWLYC